jgi:hypothetical protein
MQHRNAGMASPDEAEFLFKQMDKFNKIWAIG